MGDVYLSITRERLEALTEKHIQRYSYMLESAAAAAKHGMRSNVRVGETGMYLAIWESIKAKGYDMNALTVEERREVRDAVMDEDDCDPTEVG